jgi:hypothetical protein
MFGLSAANEVVANAHNIAHNTTRVVIVASFLLYGMYQIVDIY